MKYLLIIITLSFAFASCTVHKSKNGHYRSCKSNTGKVWNHKSGKTYKQR